MWSCTSTVFGTLVSRTSGPIILGPELEELEGLRLEFSDLRIWASDSAAIVTRQYALRATVKGRPIDAKGNETMGWVYRDGGWKIAHLHYSHPCPCPPAGN